MRETHNKTTISHVSTRYAVRLVLMYEGGPIVFSVGTTTIHQVFCTVILLFWQPFQRTVTAVPSFDCY